jgi:hypothetical protein
MYHGLRSGRSERVSQSEECQGMSLLVPSRAENAPGFSRWRSSWREEISDEDGKARGLKPYNFQGSDGTTEVMP